jgi:hypothetical protein
MNVLKSWSPTEVLTALLVCVTGIYAALTYGIMKATGRSVSAMEAQTEALTRPYVTIAPRVQPHNPIVFIRIANTGLTAAQRLRLTLDRPFYQFGDAGNDENNLMNFPVFREEIASFAPGAELIFALAQGFVIFADNADPEKTPQQFGVLAEYSFNGRRVSETTVVDLRAWNGMQLAFDSVVDALRGIKEALEN